jgi:hypothetical protein
MAAIAERPSLSLPGRQAWWPGKGQVPPTKVHNPRSSWDVTRSAGVRATCVMRAADDADDDRILELLPRNLQEVFGEGDAARRRTGPSKTSTPMTACSMCRSRTAPSSGTLHWTDSPENYVRLIRILSTHRTASRRPCMTGGFSRGARGRRARPPSTPGLTWWWFAKAKSLRYTSFSIRNCRSDSALLAAGLSPLGAGVRPQRAAWPRLISNCNSCQERVVASLSGACRLTARSEVFRPAAERAGGSRRRTLTYACSGCVGSPGLR